MKRNRHTQHTVYHMRGMTLVEVVMVSAIFGLVMFALGESIVSLYKSNAYTMAQAVQVQYARRGVQTLVRDMREMTYADDGTFPLARMEEHLIGFYSDIDRDNSVEYVEYELASTTLVKRTYNATGSPPTYSTTTADSVQILSEYAQNRNQGTSTFYYFDANGNPATSSALVTDVRFIRVQTIINVDPVRDPGQFMLRGSASLRNVKL